MQPKSLVGDTEGPSEVSDSEQQKRNHVLARWNNSIPDYFKPKVIFCLSDEIDCFEEVERL